MVKDGDFLKWRIHKETNWSAVADQAQGLLSATQITALKQFGEQQRTESELTAIGILNAQTK